MDLLRVAYRKIAEIGYEGIIPFIQNSTLQENFTYDLMFFHIEKIEHISAFIKDNCNTYNDVIELQRKYPDELKFNRQLFNHRNIPEINQALIHCTSLLRPVLLPLFKEHYELVRHLILLLQPE